MLFCWNCHRSTLPGLAQTHCHPHTAKNSKELLLPPLAPLVFRTYWIQDYAGSGQLRLVGGGGRCAGRVEVKHDGEWGSVCFLGRDGEARWAEVVCRQLGCGRVARASSSAPFGQGSGRIWLQPFFCRGTEDGLEDCSHFGWGWHFCGHEQDVGVICTGEWTRWPAGTATLFWSIAGWSESCRCPCADAVELRLSGGGNPCAGRVEVKLQGHWGSVADYNWDMKDAEVVCQQLGCGSASGAHFAVEHFGLGDGLVSLALVDCSGDEATLWDCEIRGWGPYNSSINDLDSAVVCQGFSRLVGGDGGCAGRLEVRQSRAWVGVCEDEVDMKVAQVVCRELGCGEVVAIAGSGRFGAASGSLWDGGFQCNGSEPLLSACARRPPQSQACTVPASVICSSYMGFRLENGSSGCSGRVEVAVRGTWGSVCASEWDLADAHVLCRHLGCGRAFSVPAGGSFGSGEGPLRPDAFGCSGSERHLGECPVAVLGKPPCAPGNAAAVNCSGVGFVPSLRLVGGQSLCDGRLEETITSPAWRRVSLEQWKSWDVYMVCAVLGCGLPKDVYTALGSPPASSSSPSEVDIMTEEMDSISGMGPAANSSLEEMVIVCSGSLQVRLVGSPGRCAGRVEVYSGGSWSSVCGEGWELQDAAVVCRELGCGTALEAPGWARFGAGTGPLWPYSPDCSGSEGSLWECGRTERRECGSGGGAGAVCSEQLSVRLAEGPGRCAGFLEVSYNGTWGRVCANGNSPGTAAAVCRQLGCGDRGQLSAVPAQEPTDAWLAWVGCEDGARSLWQCPSAPWHLQSCSPGEHVHVECEEHSDGTTEGHTSPYAEGGTSTGVPSRTRLAVAVASVPVPTVLCVVLGTLLCLSLGALALLLCRARAQCRGPGRAADAISNAVYEELDYKAMPEYQEVPTPPGSLLEGWVKKLPYDSGDSVQGSDTEAAPDPPAQPDQGTLDGYDDVLDVPPAASTGDISEGVAQQRWICVVPTGGIYSPPCHPGTNGDPSEQIPEHMDYDDVGSSTLGTLPHPAVAGQAGHGPCLRHVVLREVADVEAGLQRPEGVQFVQRGLAESARAQPGRGGGRRRGEGVGGGLAEVLREGQEGVGCEVAVREVPAASPAEAASGPPEEFGVGSRLDAGAATVAAGGGGGAQRRAAAVSLGSGRGLCRCGRGWRTDHGRRGSCRRRRGHGRRAGWFRRLVAVLSVSLNWRRRWRLRCRSFNISRRGSRRGRGRRCRSHHGLRWRGGRGRGRWGVLRLGGSEGRCQRRHRHRRRGGQVPQSREGQKRRLLRMLQGVRNKPLRRRLGGGWLPSLRGEASHHVPAGGPRDGPQMNVVASQNREKQLPKLLGNNLRDFPRAPEVSVNSEISCPLWPGQQPPTHPASALRFGWPVPPGPVWAPCCACVFERSSPGQCPVPQCPAARRDGAGQLLPPPHSEGPGRGAGQEWLRCRWLGSSCSSSCSLCSAREPGTRVREVAIVCTTKGRGNCGPGQRGNQWSRNCEWVSVPSEQGDPCAGNVLPESPVKGSGQLRLVGGGGRCAGRVEVKHDGEWGSVCFLGRDGEARWAEVVCRQLGCGRVARASSSAPFGQGSGRIWLQPFFCNGTEDVLRNCSHFGWGRHLCGHEQDVGVTCTDAVELRLSGGGNPCAGRVEVKLQGHWGSVADDSWDVKDAEVVCQQLGCGSASGAYFAVEHFGVGDGLVSLALVDCSGDEATLWDCEIRGWGPYNSSINDLDSAVVCQGFSRLVGGYGGCAGRLEVRQDQAWVGVCEDEVDMKVAQVVCRELGCGEVVAIAGSGRFGAVSGSLWDGGFQCNGSEPLLSACARRSPRSQGCTGPASVICSSYTGFRLGNGSSGCSGRVEVAVRGTWGSVCASEWDLADAHVLCRHLGCGRAFSVPAGGSFGSGEGPLRPDAFGCSGSERHPGECPVAVLGKPPCAPGNAAAVNCSGTVESLRLVKGETRCEGFLELAISTGEWRRVPGEVSLLRNLSNVCLELGCGGLEKSRVVIGQCFLREISQKEWDILKMVIKKIKRMTTDLATRTISENYFWADYRYMTTAPADIPHGTYIVCSGSLQVRLVGSPGRCAGRVEVYSGGSWSSVCGEGWELQDAVVVCRELGCGTALEAPGWARFGAGTGPLWPYSPDCSGSEGSLWDCGRTERRECGSGGGAGAVCSEQLSVRLAEGPGRCAGFLEVSYNGTWGRVCANGTSPGTASAVCNQLGCGDRVWLSGVPAQEPTDAWLAWVGCEDGARSLWQCPSAPWHLQSCGTDGHVHVECEEDSDGITEGHTSPYAEGGTSTGVPSRTPLAVAVGSVPVPTVLCVVLGTLLCLSLGALALLLCRARAQRRGLGSAADAISNAVYEELDYKAMPEYQEVPTPPGSLLEGWVKKLLYDRGDSVQGSDSKEAPDPPLLFPDPPAQPDQGTLDGYDDVLDVPPAASTGDISEAVARQRWISVLPTGGIYSPPCHPGTNGDPSEQIPEHMDYDDVGSNTLGTLP
ncbi:LOW QUALITY PROTEIN: uncharacterized protein LOC132328303 [Haemorhous mexicanus]|uniref:LOW QUALITY PROTEIN: uncharacterized protein LOC132328303 n=1 Tax=Haemorhous mexicanus TaxID=30427 RepID=UPI0028BE8782|nr:LOW QUALITY PROTEIN: uncharacterized protein LOC132328303 [Haemorhous mexicanus]